MLIFSVMKSVVLHSLNTRDTGLFGMVSKEDKLFDMVHTTVRNGSNYKAICAFDTAKDLEEVWEAMQSEVSPLPRTLKVRSLMVGDVIIQGNKVFVVAGCGFEELDGVTGGEYLLSALVRQAEVCGEVNEVPVFPTAARVAL